MTTQKPLPSLYSAAHHKGADIAECLGQEVVLTTEATTKNGVYIDAKFSSVVGHHHGVMWWRNPASSGEIAHEIGHLVAYRLYNRQDQDYWGLLGSRDRLSMLWRDSCECIACHVEFYLTGCTQTFLDEESYEDWYMDAAGLQRAAKIGKKALIKAYRTPGSLEEIAVPKTDDIQAWIAKSVIPLPPNVTLAKGDRLGKAITAFRNVARNVARDV